MHIRNINFAFSASILILIVILAIPALTNYYQSTKSYAREIAKVLAPQLHHSDLILCVPEFEPLLFNYYLQKNNIHLMENQLVGLTINDLSQLEINEKTVYLITRSDLKIEEVEFKKGHTTAQRHIEVLEKVLPLIPEKSEVILLGDAEYDTTDMLVWMRENTNWQFVLRTSPQIYAQGQPIGRYPSKKGRIFHVSGVDFTQTGDVRVNLIGWWGSRYEKPIYLISNIDNPYRACKYYRRRYQIETFFSDQKSRGFHIHKSHLSNPERLSRMLIAACLAYIWIL